MPLLISFLLFLPFFSQAGRFEGDPLPLQRCDLSQVNSCRAEHRDAEVTCRARADEAAAQGAATSADLARLDEALRALDSALSAAKTQIEMIHAERNFLAPKQNRTSPPPRIFPEAPALEKIFLLPAGSENWEERFPDERASKLAAQASALETNQARSAAKRETIVNEISSMTKFREDANARKNHWQNDANIHGSMWATGCETRYCGAR